MKINIKKKFKNGNHVISVNRTVTTYFKMNTAGEIKELNTIDEIRDNNFTGLSEKFWDCIISKIGGFKNE